MNDERELPPPGQFLRRVPASVAILAGGRSSRMGRNKALLAVGGETILRRTARVLRPLAAELFIVADDDAPYADLGLPVHPDLVPGGGALGGILTAVARSAHPLVLCVACDMPFLEPRLAALLLEAARPGDDAVVPRLPEGPEPLLAVYARSLLPALEGAVRSGRLRIMEALAGARVRFLEPNAIDRVDPARRSFVNVNTPGELAEARALAGEGAR